MTVLYLKCPNSFASKSNISGSVGDQADQFYCRNKQTFDYRYHQSMEGFLQTST